MTMVKKMRKRIPCALLAVTLLLSLSSCFLVSSTPEDTAKEYFLAVGNADFAKMNENAVIDIKELFLAVCEEQEITEENFCETSSRYYGFGSIPKSFDELFAAFSDFNKEMCTEQYGSDYGISCSVVASVKLGEYELSEALQNISDDFNRAGIVLTDYIETSEIKECYKIEGKIYVKGSKGEDDNTQTLYVGKIGFDWKILNIIDTVGNFF